MFTFFFYFTSLINFLVLLDEFNIFFDNIFLLLITAITHVIYYICIMLTIMLTNEPEAYDSLARLFDIVCSIKIDWQINIFTFFLIKNFLSILTVQWKERKCLLIAKKYWITIMIFIAQFYFGLVGIKNRFLIIIIVWSGMFDWFLDFLFYWNQQAQNK